MDAAGPFAPTTEKLLVASKCNAGIARIHSQTDVSNLWRLKVLIDRVTTVGPRLASIGTKVYANHKSAYLAAPGSQTFLKLPEGVATIMMMKMATTVLVLLAGVRLLAAQGVSSMGQAGSIA